MIINYCIEVTEETKTKLLENNSKDMSIVIHGCCDNIEEQITVTKGLSTIQTSYYINKDDTIQLVRIRIREMKNAVKELLDLEEQEKELREV